MQFDPGKASLAHSRSLALPRLTFTHTLHLWLHSRAHWFLRGSVSEKTCNALIKCFCTVVTWSSTHPSDQSAELQDVPIWTTNACARTFLASYLFKMSRTRPHEHHRMISVGVRSHWGHAVRPLVVQRQPLDDPQPSERLVQDQATKIITDLLRLERRNKSSQSYSR